MTHFFAPPAPSRLRPGDTVTMSAKVGGPTRRLYTHTPCCYARVFIEHGDVDWMLRQNPLFAMNRHPEQPWTPIPDGPCVERKCAGCGWPYKVRLSHGPALEWVSFEVGRA